MKSVPQVGLAILTTGVVLLGAPILLEFGSEYGPRLLSAVQPARKVPPRQLPPQIYLRIANVGQDRVDSLFVDGMRFTGLWPGQRSAYHWVPNGAGVRAQIVAWSGGKVVGARYIVDDNGGWLQRGRYTREIDIRRPSERRPGPSIEARLVQDE